VANPVVLSGRSPAGKRCRVKNSVWFFSDRQIAAYGASGEPLGCAGLPWDAVRGTARRPPTGGMSIEWLQDLSPWGTQFYKNAVDPLSQVVSIV